MAFVLPDSEHSATTRWVLVLTYVATAAGWWRAGVQSRESGNRASEPGRDIGTQSPPREVTTPSVAFAWWWKLGALLLFFLAISKAVDLRAQCETWIRHFAKASGWWERRLLAQFVLAIVLPVLAGLAFGAIVFTRARQFSRQYPLAVAGWLLVYLYLACRQSLEWKPALHWLISIRYFDWRLLMEATGLLLLIAAATRAGPRK